MRDFPEALVQMALMVGPLSLIEVILEFHEQATMGKGFPETELKVPEHLEPLVSAQEVQRLKGNFPDICAYMVKSFATLVQIGKYQHSPE